MRDEQRRMDRRHGVILAIIYVISIAAITQAVLAQTNSLTIGAFTIDATGTPALTVKPPTRAGTLAITADIPAPPPASNVIAGQAQLAGGVVTVTIPAQAAAPICIATDTTAASPVRVQAATVNSVTFEGVTNHLVNYACTAKNN